MHVVVVRMTCVEKRRSWRGRYGESGDHEAWELGQEEIDSGLTNEVILLKGSGEDK